MEMPWSSWGSPADEAPEPLSPLRLGTWPPVWCEVSLESEKSTMSLATAEKEGHRPLHVFLVNETDRPLEFCDAKSSWGEGEAAFLPCSICGRGAHPLSLCPPAGHPVVKHDRYRVAPNQSCVVFAREGDLVLGSSPFGPKGEFGMRFADSLENKFTVTYNHPMYCSHSSG